MFFAVQATVLFAGIAYSVLELGQPVRGQFAMWFLVVLVIVSVTVVLVLKKLGIRLLVPR